MSEHTPIDFVVPWVDGGDLEWQKQRAHYLNPDVPINQIDFQESRYRDWETMRYWFRAVEKYAPWVNKVHFVTCGQLPDWLNLDAPKLNFVKHSDYMPQEYLPTFSSHPIEWNFHRIPGLSEQFVLFNDDLFLTAPVQPEDFFVNGLPCDCLEETPVTFDYETPMNSVRVNEMVFINQRYNRQKCRKQNRNKWYSLKCPHAAFKNAVLGILNNRAFFGFNTHHLPQAYLKRTFEQMWEQEPELLHETCLRRFRDERDVSHYICKITQLLTGNFQPYDKRSYGTKLHVGPQIDQICRQLKEGKIKTLSIMETPSVDFEPTKKKLLAAMEAAFPEKSSFEK